MLGMTLAALAAPFGGLGRWATAHAVEIIASIATLVMLCRAIPAASWQRLEADWPRVANVVRVLRALFPDVVKAVKALYSIWTGRPWPLGGTATLITNEPTATRVPPLPVLLMLAALALAGCPHLPPVSGCTPRDTHCTADGVPEVCSGTGRWTRLHDVAACPSVGLVCCRNTVVGPQPTYGCAAAAACLPEPVAPSDAGAADAE
jgi:hypothetical protein